MEVQTRWWHGILARSLMAVVGIALLMGGMSSLLVSRMVGERVHDQAVVKLGELLDTVESTASIACFVSDEQLAKELVQGLLRNSEVFRVSLRTGERELAHAERKIGKVGSGRTALRSLLTPSVNRVLYSPFKADEVIGEIRIDADWAEIDARMDRYSRFIGLLFAGLLALVIAAAAAMMLFLVIRPVKATSDRLHRLDPASGERLDVPEGHERTEIGRLVEDINALSGRLVETLDQERALRRQKEIDQRKYQDLFDNAGSGIFVAGQDGVLESFNRALVELIWLPRQEGAQRRLTDTGWSDPERLLALLRASLDTGGDVPAEDDFLLVGRRGDERWLHVAVVSLGDGSVQGTVTDVTQRKRDELSARRLAVTDSLTGFSNRVGLHRSLAELDPAGSPFALVMLDLDGFKQINDAFGFPVGDRLLLGVAGRLREMLDEADLPARIGGDEFALVLAGEQDRAITGVRIERIAEHLAQPYELQMDGGQNTLVVSASLGIALFPRDGLDVQQLLRAAELALNSARDAGGRSHRFFDPALQEAVEHRRRLEDDLRAAVAARELKLAFQPIVDLRQRRLAGAEVLLRWSHPQHGNVSPEVFIPLAEEIGLIGAIGLAVLDEACRQVALWRSGGLDIYVSVNVSACQIPDDLPPVVVMDIMGRYALPPEAIAIEITEGVLMSDVGVAQAWIESLRAAGLRIYLDDFGTGYSSLSYLKRFPLDTVKIDKSFIRDLHVDNSDRTLVAAIITMAASLGLNVVAEGVEDERQLALLDDMGCGFGQGYHFSRPVAATDFLETVQRIDAELLRHVRSA